ncbi:MAG: type II secretion system protein [Holophaga sp.]|nr:type II secretion system protein [Holophaga sp.]
MVKQKGFTLVEAAVAIGVVAILSGIIIPLVLKSVRDARNAQARNDINVIAAAIASQLKDTGTRPRAAGGGAVNNATGAGPAIWFSGGTPPDVVTVAGAAGIPLPPADANTFVNLFTHPNHDGNELFNIVAAAGDEFQYKGPYLGTDMAEKTDPWGRAYLILGYNERGQINGGTIWVVCAGEQKTILDVNLPAPPAAGAGPLGPDAWRYTGGSASNLAVRVN